MKLLVSWLLMVSSALSYAGLPDEDYTVDLTRESFRDGVKPNETDLYFNFQWVCGTYRTLPGTMTGTTGITLGAVFFLKEGTNIINRSFYFPGKVPLKPSEAELSSVIINEAGNTVGYYFIRKNHDGLLVEIAVPSSNPVLPAISAPELQAVSYAYCLPYDFNSKAPKIMNYPWSDVYSND